MKVICSLTLKYQTKKLSLPSVSIPAKDWSIVNIYNTDTIGDTMRGNQEVQWNRSMIMFFLMGEMLYVIFTRDRLEQL